MYSVAGHIRWRQRTGPRYRYVRWRWRLLCGAIDALGTVLFWIFRKVWASWTGLAGQVQGVLRFLWNGAAFWRGSRAASGKKLPDGKAPVQRILVIQLDHLGDAVLSQVLFPLLRRHYPEAEIDVLASPWNQEVFRMIPEVHRVHLWEGNRFRREGRSSGFWKSRGSRIFGVFGWGVRLRRWKYDLGFDVRGELPHAMLMWLAGIRRRVGWSAGGGGFLLTDSPSYVPHRPEVDSRLALLAVLGIEPDLPRRAIWPRLLPSVCVRQRIAARLAELEKQDDPFPEKGRGHLGESSVSHRLPWIVCHIGAGTEAKQWPLEHWTALIATLLARQENVLLIGGVEDRPKAQEILHRLDEAFPLGDVRALGIGPHTQEEKSFSTKGPVGERLSPASFKTAPFPEPVGLGRVVDWSGQLTVEELAALLERVEVLVGADSGPAHLAAAVGTPVVVLFSGTNRVRQWRPRGRVVRVICHPVACRPCHRTRCPLPDHPCMHRITPQQVLEVLNHLSEAAGKNAVESQEVSFSMGEPRGPTPLSRTPLENPQPDCRLSVGGNRRGPHFVQETST